MILRHEEFGIQIGNQVMAPEALVGYVLHDPLGQKIGKVEKVFSNGTGEPEYIKVRLGGVLDRRSILLPVEIVTMDEGRRILALG